jgi:uncharacterized protein YutE (UPF0331/DUF86 family)
MDRTLIEEKMEALRHCIMRIEDKRPDSVEKLRADLDLQDIVTLNLTRAVQLSVDIASHIISGTEAKPPGTMAEAFLALASLGFLEKEVAEKMIKAVGFRNIAVHNYQTIDWQIVYNICHHNLDDFSRFAKSVAQKLPDV